MRNAMVRVYVFSDIRTDAYERLQMLLLKKTLSSVIIPTSVTNLTI